MRLFTNTAPETEDIGLSDNDIDGFLKDLLESVVRESAQNSNDEAEKRPVRMNIDLLEMATAEIPDVGAYKEVLERCLTEAQSTKSRKAEEFFKNAVKVLSRDKVQVLSIADSGTRGAGGEFKKGGKFYTLAISKGRTDKDNIYSAGSFGIGKNAAFAGSELRLVFYSSRFAEAGEEKFYCLGKSVLTSWRNDADENMGNKVYFGESEKEVAPVCLEASVPAWLKKDDLGLRIGIVAPRVELRDGWHAGYISSLLSNFFIAIFDGNLEFSLDNGAVVINRATMLSHFEDEQVIAAAKNAGMSDRLKWARFCSEALAAHEFHSEYFTVPELGSFEVMIKVAEDLPKRVFFIRNGMYITDTLKHFGKLLQRFPNTKDFVAIVRPKSVEDSSSEMIKRMENPEHNELTAGYIADEDEVRKLTAAMQILEGKVRSVVNEFAEMEVLETREIDELREFIPDMGAGAKESKDSEESDPTAVMTTSKKLKKRGTGFSPGGTKGGSGNRGRKKVKKKGKGKGAGSSGKGKFKYIDLTCKAVKSGGDKSWVVQISDIPEAGKFEISPEERSRGNETRSVCVTSCNLPGSNISGDGLKVEVDVQAGKPQKFEITLESDNSVIDLRPTLIVQGN